MIFAETSHIFLWKVRFATLVFKKISKTSQNFFEVAVNTLTWTSYLFRILSDEIEHFDVQNLFYEARFSTFVFIKMNYKLIRIP